MGKSLMPKDFKVYLAFIISVLVFVLMIPKAAKFSYDYKKGSSWKYETLVAQFDFPIYKTEEQIKEEKANAQTSVIPYYKYSDEVVNRSIKTADALNLGRYSDIKPKLITSLRNIYSHGVIQNETRAIKRNNLDPDLLYIQKNKRAIKSPTSEVYKLADANALLIAELTTAFPSYNLDSIFKADGIYDIIAPNLIFDEQTTSLVKAESENDVSPTQGFVKAGQLIVSKDEIITAEIEQMLDSYRKEYDSSVGYNGPWIFSWLGRLMIAFVVMLILFLVILQVDNSIFSFPNKLYYILFIFFLAAFGAVTIGANGQDYIYLSPFVLTILYLRTFFKYSTIVPLYAVCLLPLLIFRQDGPQLYVMFFAAGLASVFIFKFSFKGWKQFIPGFVAFLVLLITYLGFKMIGLIADHDDHAILFLFIGSFISSAAYPLAYIFERVFKLLSNTRLNELTDSENTLVRELEDKAPGTFQHCLQVMSMAEAVGRSINANLPLLRAGALYHDIGKTVNPLCFVENATVAAAQDADSSAYHSKLSAKQSASDIINHVSDGLALADRHHLPEQVKDFILTHHGTSRVGYFYNKFVNDGGDPEDVESFTYKGMKPQTKEQVIVMLCDGIEAASRTLKDNSTKAYSDFVEKMVCARMNEGQLDEANITLKEINILKESLKSYLAQMYHERVAYPKRRKVRN